ncbi:MAG TPA: tetratricopeptide repeat protein [Gemmatimonadaceae bacterium]|nr:tetratricopeptide repeat protein [Gemmatimonadaceae bacterium]
MASSPRIEELRKKFEENPRRYFAPLANEYRKAGDIDQAVAICREYLPQQPGHMSGHIVYGQALYEARQFEESKTVFETALSLDPENLIALRHLGDIALIVGDTEGARGWYRRVLEADPRNEEIQSQLATLEQSASTSPTPVTTPVEPESAASAATTLVVELSSDLTPLSMPAVPVTPDASADASRAPTTEVVVENLSNTPTAEVHLDPIQPAASHAPASKAVSGLELESPVAGASAQEEGLISGFSLEGLESFERPAEEADAPPSSSEPLPFVDLGPTASTPESNPVGTSAPFPDFDFSGPAAAQQPDASTAEVPGSAEPAAPAAAPKADSGPFVTETMADLYLKQGHREEALRVYRALLEQRPGDAALRAKVAGLEPAAGPTIREILTILAMRRPGHRPHGAGHEENGKSTPSQQQKEAVAPESPTAPMAPAEIPTVPLSPAESSAPATATLSELFGGAAVSESDESAAHALALSFAGSTLAGADSALDSLDTTGAPAHLATNELSLDTVFGTGKSVAAPSSFSFDQFFSRRATTPPASSVQAPADADANATDDIADFTQWLEGLKQK